MDLTVFYMDMNYLLPDIITFGIGNRWLRYLDNQNKMYAAYYVTQQSIALIYVLYSAL